MQILLRLTMMNILAGKTREGPEEQGVCADFSIQVEACVLLLGFCPEFRFVFSKLVQHVM